MDWVNTELVSALQGHSVVAISLAYLGGVLTSATPCVYPVIPITVAVIGASHRKSSFQSFFQSLVYVAGMALVYGGLGIFAAGTGRLFGEISTHPWVYFLVANLCFFFAIWMMEWVRMGGFQWKSSAQPKGIGLARIFLMGGASGLVAGPCTAPVLATLLTYVATTGNMIFGGLVMFSFAYGLGTLLIVVGTFSALSVSLPKSGSWLLWVKRCLAVIMFGMGEYFLIQMGTLMI